MRKAISLLLLVIFTSVNLSAQEDLLTIDNLEINNVSDKINDGTARVTAKGGQPPYIYYWSNVGTDTLATKANGLVEGIEYSITVKDANGIEVSESFEIESQSVAENFNGTFKPIVDAVASVIFWDPFYAMGLYDNRVYTDDGQLSKNPNGTVRTNQIPFIVIWLIFGGVVFHPAHGLDSILGMAPLYKTCKREV